MPAFPKPPAAALERENAAMTRAEAIGEGAAGPAITRAGFLRGTLATIVAASSGASLATLPIAGAEAAVSPAISPLALRFSIIEQFRPFDLLPERFTQVSDRFAGAAAARYIGGEARVDGQRAKVTGGAKGLRMQAVDAAPALFRTGSRPVAPFATVIVSIGTTAAGSGATAAVLAGLVRDSRNYVAASFDAGRDATNGLVSIEVVVNGTRTRAASAAADLTGPARFAFVINENYVTALVGNATNWVPITRFRITDLVDMRDPATLRNYNYGFGAAGEDAVVEITGFEAGYFGEAGLRDTHVVNWADGTPYIKGNKLYFTATQAGFGFFQAAHWGVWTLDLDDPSRIEPVGKIFSAREDLVLGDHAGHIVVDGRDGGFHVATSGWGDFDFEGVRVHYVRTFENVLEGIHVLETRPMPLPTRVDSWDPAMVRINNRWYVGFVESPYQDPVRGFDFRPALARSAPGGSILELARVGADLTRGETEGIILQKIGNRWYLLASDGDEDQYRVYDLSVRLLGFLNAPYGTNIPHPQIVPIPDRGRTYYLLITFNGTQYYERLLGYGTHGDFIVMRAAQTVSGYEFEPRPALRGTAAGRARQAAAD